jgi:NADP-dependent 3-hydroxy acid dehydrogenase YdfG
MKQAKNLVVTGASSDLGKNLLGHIDDDYSYKIVSTSRNAMSRDNSVNRVHLSGLDLSNGAHLGQLARVAGDFFNEPFSIIHFAGDFWRHKPLIDTSYDEIQQMMISHYFTLCGVALALTPAMIKHRGGRLIALSCNSVAYSYPDLSPFTSAKAAIESFVKCYSNEYSPYQISSTAIALPTIRTTKVLEEKMRGDTNNYVEPDELSQIILSEVLHQSNYVTGNVMRIIKHSDTFYNSGYFERNPRSSESARKMANIAIDSDG